MGGEALKSIRAPPPYPSVIAEMMSRVPSACWTCCTSFIGASQTVCAHGPFQPQPSCDSMAFFLPFPSLQGILAPVPLFPAA